MRYGQKCKGGKFSSRQAAWKAEPILHSERALSYFLKIVLRLLGEYCIIKSGSRWFVEW